MDGEQEAPPRASPKEKRILIVDDDDSVRSFLETIVQAEGFNVVTACNGTEAAEKMGDQPPDLIISDLMMPGEGGYELLRRLQSSGRGLIPVFIITASRLDDTTLQMIRREANVVQFIPKPVPVGPFVLSLHNILKTAPSSGNRSRGLNDR